MKILAVGGGSGGHVTPVAAVLQELRQSDYGIELRFWSDKKFASKAAIIIGSFDKTILVSAIAAGKFRRYNHVSMLRQLLWPSVVFKNFIDLFLVFAGLLQSIAKLIIWRPDVVFIKGGYVCLPVGVAARILGIPIVIHDSDTHPGLTNRILSKWAKVITTGAPLKNYNYPDSKAYYVGIPISPDFHKFTDKERKNAKKQWGIGDSDKLIVVIGGGLGAKNINDIVAKNVEELLGLGSLVLISGDFQYEELRSTLPKNNDKFQLHAFVSRGLAELLGAADVVVSRAGATSTQELAALAVPTIIIPNAKLTGGHQVKNAKVYADAGAAVSLDEGALLDSPRDLVKAIKGVLQSPTKTAKMTKIFQGFARPNAAKDVARIIIKSCDRL